MHATLHPCGRSQVANIWRGTPPDSGVLERHSDVELAFVERGSVSLSHGRTTAELGCSDLAVFWGMIPHRVAASSVKSLACRFTVPLSVFLGWRLPQPFSRQVLRGEVLVDRGGEHTGESGATFRVWADELPRRSVECQAIALLEAEAKLRRFARASHRPEPDRRPEEPVPGGADRVASMARFIAETHTEPVRIADIARRAHLNPHYAETLFQKTCGMGLHECVNRHRIAHAQWLLVTSDASVTEIAFSTGFSSLSRFYANFRQECAVTPRQYRAQSRADDPLAAASVSGGSVKGQSLTRRRKSARARKS